MREQNVGSAKCIVVKSQASEIDPGDAFRLDLVFVGEQTNTRGCKPNSLGITLCDGINLTNQGTELGVHDSSWMTNQIDI